MTSRDDIGDQTLLPRDVLPGYNDGFLHRLQVKQGQFNLRNLYPLATHFDLKVFASQMDETAIRLHDPQVASAINPFFSLADSRLECRVGEIRLLPVSEGEKATLDGDFTDLIVVYLFPLITQHQHRLVFDGIARRDKTPGDLGAVVEKIPAEIFCLRRAKRVHQDTGWSKMLLVQFYISLGDRLAQ